MATVTATTALNMSNGFTFAITQTGQPVVGSFGSTQIVVFLDGTPSPNTGIYNGVFTYTESGIFSTSLVHSYTHSSPTLSYSVSGISLMVGTYFSFLDAGNSIGLRQLILGGFDQINGSAFNDVLYADGGNDTLNGGAGADQMFGGTGDDTYVVDNAADVSIENPDEGTDTIFSAGSYSLNFPNVENLTLTGGAHVNGTGNGTNNLLVGNAGNNVLDGGAGIDTLQGGQGNDTYVVDSTQDVILEEPLALGGGDLVLSSVSFALPANVESLELIGSASINGVGNDLPNAITGNSGDNMLDGRGVGGQFSFASDTLAGGAGNDTYFIGGGNGQVIENLNEGIDTVKTFRTFTLPDHVENLQFLAGFSTAPVSFIGNALDNLITSGVVLGGGNTLAGGAGDDTYVVGNSVDIILENAGEGIDTVRTSITYTLPANIENAVVIINPTGASVIGNAQANKLTGSAGSDTLSGGNGDDLITGDAGDDSLSGGDGNDVIIGGIGNDIFEGGFGIDTADYSGINGPLVANLNPSLGLFGTASSLQSGLDLIGNIEILLATAFDDSLTGNTGNNVFFGGLGNDTLDGGAGNDQLFGEGDHDSLSGGSGGDYLLGGLGNDTLTGGDDADALFGEDNFDLINGDAGDDVLIGGNGADTLNGGEGVDTAIGEDGNDQLSGGDGVDLLYGYADNDTLNGGSGGDLLSGGLGNDQLNGGDDSDALFGEENDDTLNGDAGDDVLVGGSGNDTLNGGAGGDTLIGEAGNETLNGGADNDQMFGYGDLDTLNGGDGNDFAAGGDGNDQLNGDAGGDVLDGEAGNDLLNGGTEGDNLNGNLDDDTLNGGSGADGMLGWDGDDVLSGDTGNDYMFGDRPDGLGTRGNDRFVFQDGTGNDSVFDFQGGAGVGDVIDLRGMGFATFSAVTSASSNLNGGVFINLDAGNPGGIAGDALFIANIGVSALVADDFLLV